MQAEFRSIVILTLSEDLECFGRYITKKIIWTFIICLGAMSICLVLICAADFNDIPPHFNIFVSQKVNPWTEVFVSLLSSFLAATATILAVLLTLDSQEKQRQEDNKKQALPILKIEKSKLAHGLLNNFTLDVKSKPLRISEEEGYYGKFSKDISIQIENVGMREMYDLSLEVIDNTYFTSIKERKLTPILYKDDSFDMDLILYPHIPNNISINMYGPVSNSISSIPLLLR